MTGQPVSMTVNGHPVRLVVTARTHLADALREELDLTGTHLGCEHGICGACTLLIDGTPQRACLTLAAGCEGAEVTTVEGFGDDPLMKTLRANFSDHHALQCGYCTPGMLATAYDIVRRLPDADETRIREELAGNLCRCTGYVGIVRAIQTTLAAFPTGHPHRAADDTTAQGGRTFKIERTAPIPTKPVNRTDATGPMSMAHVDGMTELTRKTVIDLPVSTLWDVLSDIERVAACLPGVALTSSDPLDNVTGTLTVTIGPMKARFDGAAAVTFDGTNRSGSVVGEGRDAISRSSATGAVRFRAYTEDGASVLETTIRYAVVGPFAQFSRGTLVATVVGQFLDSFAANLVRTARGETIQDQSSLGLAGLARLLFTARLAALRRWLQSLFRS